MPKLRPPRLSESKPATSIITYLRDHEEISDLPSPLLRSLRANGSRISRSADRLDPWNPLIYRWEMRKGSVRLCLIPIGDRVVIVRSVIGMAVLDGGF